MYTRIAGGSTCNNTAPGPHFFRLRRAPFQDVLRIVLTLGGVLATVSLGRYITGLLCNALPLSLSLFYHSVSLPVCVSACLSVSLPPCLSVCPSVCLSVCLSPLLACLPACLPDCLPACLVCVCVCLCLSVRPSVYLSLCFRAACLPAYLSVRLSVCLISLTLSLSLSIHPSLSEFLPPSLRFPRDLLFAKLWLDSCKLGELHSQRTCPRNYMVSLRAD